MEPTDFPLSQNPVYTKESKATEKIVQCDIDLKDGSTVTIDVTVKLKGGKAEPYDWEDVPDAIDQLGDIREQLKWMFKD